MLPRMVTVGEKMKKLRQRVVRDHKLVSTSSTNEFFSFFLFIWAHLPETKEREGGYLIPTLGSNLKPATSHSPTTGRLHNSNAESFRQWGVDQNISLTEYLQNNNISMTVFLSSYIWLELQSMRSRWFPLGYSLNTSNSKHAWHFICCKHKKI